MDTIRTSCQQAIADARKMRTQAAATLERARAAAAHAEAYRANIQRVPHCPRCHRVTGVEEDDSTGSSQLWFVCRLCGHRWGVSPKTIR
jgi:transposase-like protein